MPFQQFPEVSEDIWPALRETIYVEEEGTDCNSSTVILLL